MRLTLSLGLFAVSCLLVGVSCATLGATDAADSPDGGQTPGTIQGTVGTLCASAIDGCGWTALECSSDPECAHWYSCVLDCHPVHGLPGCLEECAGSQPSSSIATALHKCLGSAGSGVCGADADPGTKVDIEAGADSAVDSGNHPFFASCAECVLGSCQTEINSCSTSNSEDCLSYKATFESCANATTQQDYEKCLLAADKESSAKHDKFSTSGALACIVANCTQTCLPSDYQPCMECSQGKCADALDAWLHDAIAQDLAWCRNACKGEADCTASCKAQYGDGAGVLSALIACQSKACPACGF